MMLFLLLLASLNIFVSASNPCAARSIQGHSVVCVCNSTYCDDVVRTVPAAGTYVVYTSSKSGLRFKMKSSTLRPPSEIKEECCSVNIVVNPNKEYQKVMGFGGAVTDAAGINWRQLSKPLQQHLIKSYFGETGLEYNMIRVPIGGSDFSTHPYAYNESPANDTKLTNFTLSVEDTMYKIPMIKEAMKIATKPIFVVASTWSPPVWMKTNGKITGSSRLRKEYYQTYADYHLRFIQKYTEENIPIWAITTTNEPLNGIVPIAQFNSLGWTPSSMAEWITKNLEPTIRNSTFNDTLIFALDDQRYMIPLFFDKMVKYNPSVMNYIDGLAVHYYGDLYTPAAVLSTFANKNPTKLLIATEACEGSFPWDLQKVILGSWTRAEHYIKDIIEDLSNLVMGWVDWNLCLNTEGGPNWVKNYVDSPIIVTGPNEFVKQPMFYALGHFTKFIPRYSKRCSIENKSWLSKISGVGFNTPIGTTVVVLHNGGSKKLVRIQIDEQVLKLKMEANSISTIEIKL